jgi:tetratricopeptide (TPR) repeat protein
VASYLTRAFIYEDLGEFDEAIADFTRTIALDPSLAEASVGRSAARFGRGDLEAALADATQAARLDPQNPQVYLGRARIFIEKHEYPSAKIARRRSRSIQSPVLPMAAAQRPCSNSGGPPTHYQTRTKQLGSFPTLPKLTQAGRESMRHWDAGTMRSRNTRARSI